MNITSLAGARPARGRLLRFVIDQNPFYLLSAACMLGGLLTLTNSLSYTPIPQRNLLLLIATLNCYELLLVALALWLIVNRKLIRDGAILLGIEALFLADTAMLNAELFTVDGQLGAAVNLGLLLLTAVKLAVIFRALRVRSAGAYFLILVSLLFLFALPGIFKQVSTHDNGRLAALVVYWAWWGAGLLPIGFAYVFQRKDTAVPAVDDLRPSAYRGIIFRFGLFAFISILIHLRLTNWVYQVRWEWANLAPLVLGLAVGIGSLDRHAHTLALRLRSQLALPVLAIALSLWFSSDLIFAIGPALLSPMRFAFLGAAAVYLHGLWLHRHIYFAIGAAICLALVGLGASPAMAWQNGVDVWNRLVAILGRVHPRTAGDWGVLSVIASFLLLVLGAMISILRGPAPDANLLMGSNEGEAPPAPPAAAG